MTQATSKPGIFSWYFRVSMLKRIVFALVAGAAVGIIMAGMPADTAAAYAANTKFFGDLFIRLLQMIVVPVIFFSVISGASSLAPAQLGRVGTKLMVLYLVTTFIAVGVALVFANIFQPGLGLNVIGTEEVQGRDNTAPGLAAIFLNLVPPNPFNAIVQGQLLPILFFAILFGFSLAIIRASDKPELAKAGDTVYYFCSGCAEAVYKIVWGVMQYAPIGIFFLISAIFGVQGPKVVGSMFHVIAVTYAAFIVYFIVVYSGIVALVGLSPLKLFKGGREAIITGFVTRSSNATLPVTIRVMEENLGIPRNIVSFAAPFGATVNMDGAAIYLGVTAMFIGFATGQPLGFEQQLMVALLATLGAIGAAGVPGAGVIMLLMVLEGIGLKVEAGSAVAAAYALMFAVDAILDMGRTCLNVTGDLALTPAVCKQEGILDMSKW
jgi:Na+/H+-dicarboxylate symporter